MGLKYHFVNNKFELRLVHGEFKKWPGTTKSHVMTEQMPELWAGVDVFSTTTDCTVEMVKTGRLLKLAWRSANRPPSSVQTHTNTHTHTQKTLWVVFPVSSLRQTINTKKERLRVCQGELSNFRIP